jgi:hypothetical protein
MAAFLRRALNIPASSKDFFKDDDNSIFEGDINAIAAAGITKGCNPPDNNRYCPDLTVSRGAMAAFLRRALNLPVAVKDHFIDDDNSIFEGDINAIASAGITKGCNPPANDRYCPDLSVSRGAMAAFLRRAVLSGSLLPNLGATPNPIDFGEVAGSSALTLTLTHPGPSSSFAIVVDRTEITGPNAAEFSDLFNDASDVTILPNGTLSVGVLFTPVGVGPKSATLTVYHSGGNTPLTVPLIGVGLAVELTAEPSSLAFDPTPVDASDEIELTITNVAPSGSPSIFVDGASIEGVNSSEFMVLGPPVAGERLQPGESFQFSIQFDPDPPKGQKVADLVIEHDGDGSPTRVSLSGVALNSPPVAVADSYSTDEDIPLNVNAASGVLDNDTDEDGDGLSAVLVTGVSDGSLTLNPNGSFDYTPDADFNGEDSFTYKANDGALDSNTVTVTITVTPTGGASTVTRWLGFPWLIPLLAVRRRAKETLVSG